MAQSNDVNVEQLKQAVSIFDRDELPTTTELGRVMALIGLELPEAHLQNMINYVKQDRDRPNKIIADDFKQGVLVGEAKPNETKALRHHLVGDGPLPTVPKGGPAAGLTTVVSMWNNAVKLWGPKNCVGSRKPGADYSWVTYSEIDDRATNYGKGLCDTFKKKKGDFVGIHMATRPEWVEILHGHLKHGLVTVTLYQSYGNDALNYILNETEATVVVTDSPVKLLSAIPQDCKSFLEGIVVVGAQNDTDEIQKLAAQKNVKVVTLQQCTQHGSTLPNPPLPEYLPSDQTWIIYTSGTTGNPKGVMHTNKTFAAAMCAFDTEKSYPEPGEVRIGFLPMAHVMELLIQCGSLYCGSPTGFWQGDPFKLMEDVVTLKPTSFVMVPRILNRIYTQVKATSEQAVGIRKVLSEAAFASKKKGIQTKGYLRSFWDFVIFNKVKDTLGGKVKSMAVGSAPITPEILDFMTVYFGCLPGQGFGMTECCITNGTAENDFRVGSVGPPHLMVEQKLVSVPDMGYLVTDTPYPRGQLCLRGACVTPGYFKNPQQTKASIDADGWLYTGDIGLIKPNGTLVIIDRLKDMFKLSIGEYISPEKIENIIARSPFVAQSLVHGNSLTNFVVAVVVPDPAYLMNWAKASALVPATGNEAEILVALCQNPKVVEAVLSDICGHFKKEKEVSAYEIPKGILLSPVPFSVENGTITPTYKLKRRQALALHQSALDTLVTKLQ